MSTSKRLDPDALRKILKRCMGHEVTWQEVGAIKDHITALERALRCENFRAAGTSCHESPSAWGLCAPCSEPLP